MTRALRARGQVRGTPPLLATLRRGARERSSRATARHRPHWVYVSRMEIQRTQEAGRRRASKRAVRRAKPFPVPGGPRADPVPSRVPIWPLAGPLGGRERGECTASRRRAPTGSLSAASGLAASEQGVRGREPLLARSSEAKRETMQPDSDSKEAPQGRQASRPSPSRSTGTNSRHPGPACALEGQASP